MEKRGANLTNDQKKVLIDFLEAHEKLRTAKFSYSFTKKQGQLLWEELTGILNSMPGAKKDWHQWRKVSKLINSVFRNGKNQILISSYYHSKVLF